MFYDRRSKNFRCQQFLSALLIWIFFYIHISYSSAKLDTSPWAHTSKRGKSFSLHDKYMYVIPHFILVVWFTVGVVVSFPDSKTRNINYVSGCIYSVYVSVSSYYRLPSLVSDGNMWDGPWYNYLFKDVETYQVPNRIRGEWFRGWQSRRRLRNIADEPANSSGSPSCLLCQAL